MNKFSVVIITLNEEINIGRCIDAASLVSDDIVVVDSGSSDKTVVIAKEKGVKVFIREWEGFSSAKNFGAEKTAFDWIVSIDADEVITHELASNINSVELNEKTIYQINVLSNFLGVWVKYSGWYPSWKKRIYNKNIYHWNNAEVHEALVGEKKHKLQKLKGDLLHYSYISTEDVETKVERYSKLLAKGMVKNKKSVGGMKRYFGPTYKFVNTFIFKLGVLDGVTGYKISKMNARVVAEKIKYYDFLKKREKSSQ